MIRIREGKDGAPNKIYFEPRAGFTRSKYMVPSLDFPLVYGHKCTKCNNVIQALFKAPKSFSLWPYEETVLLSKGEKNVGDVRTVYPTDKTRFGKSCYRQDFRPADGGSVKIVLKNHILRHVALEDRDWTGDGLWEDGEKPCTHTGVFSIREDLLVKDFLLFSGMLEQDITKYNAPTICQLIPEDDKIFKAIHAVGEAPPVILIEKQNIVFGYHHEMVNRLAPYRKTT